ncbi:GH92 family glycosyl hydrolase [Chitinophaga rhizophila]|uniref:GH92 family glycosyl hydrolase n=1 Tax=Chitinophaga rhizophila TaxID=2866212 RepID=A0ABS7GI66_9BACT|nr:GH92 family glycosyl hydrolase [Chitinophaga rhizophila]MBW8686840.1 GH92 family glycosyl hydrolase [Chitinophaga rhizophila]
MQLGLKHYPVLAASLLWAGMQVNGQDKKPTFAAAKDFKPSEYVNPYIGSGGHGHVFLGASVPFGAVQVGPTNIVKGWDWCSGYHYSDSVVIGFPQTHLSGTGIGDLGDVLIMPYTGKIRTNRGTQENPTSGYGSRYTHAHETAKPGYYAVKLEDYNINVELTASERVGFHKYTFPQGEEGHIIIDLKEGIGWDAPVETFIQKKDDYTLVGYRFSKGWAEDQRLWFAIKSSVPMKDFQVFDGDNKLTGIEGKGKTIKGVISFEKAPAQAMLKVGISPVSSENALGNINKEIPSWDFAGTVKTATDKWNKELSKIQLQTKDTANRSIFYTAMYHTMIGPALFNDHDRSYRGTDKKAYPNPGFDNYTVFSLWDIYRSCAPLYTLTQPERVSSFVNSMLTIHKQQGKLPIWPLVGSETNCMVGYHAVPIIADAYLKGFKGFDINEAFEAMKASATRDDLGMKDIKAKGYIPADKEYESVSKAMEYAIDDWCIAAVAKKLGKTEDFAYFSKRAGYYKNYFDSTIKFVRPRMDDGSFKTPYDPFHSIHEKGDFTEGNGWQYTWLVPQDVEGLISLMGGDDAFTKKLDSLFVASGDMGAEASNDISGLIGMYAHGNEPSHHVTYMYAYAGNQWKTAEKVRQVMKDFYTTTPEGLAGNEDVGAMSSWYIFSSLGFYPVNPAKGMYVFGSPLFEKATMKLQGGKTFTVESINNSPENIYIQQVTLNGKPYNNSYIRHADIVKGGTLKITMGNKPAYDFGKAPANRPDSKY